MAIAMATPAFAQPPEQSTVVDEIIVTTERRAESLQDVPVAVTAIDSEQKEKIGIITIQDLAQFTPGVFYSTSTDRPAIRGIGRQSNTHSLDSPVSSYVDGVYTSTVQDGARRPMFVERNEVLRGPQGALSGRGSIAGSINTILKRPSEEFGGAVGVTVGNYDRFIFDGTITGPITDWLQGRLNASVTRQGEGYFENVAIKGQTEGSNLANRNTYDALFTAQFTEEIDAFLKFGWTDYKEKRRTTFSLAPYTAGADVCNPSPGTGSIPAASYGFFGPGLACREVKLNVTGIPAGNPLGSPTQVPFDNQAVVTGGVRTNPATRNNPRVYNTDRPAVQELTEPYHNITFHLNWELPWANVKYITGYQDYAYEHNTDNDGTPVESYLIGQAVYNPNNPSQPTVTTRRIFPGAINRYEERQDWYSHEINVASVGDSALQWIGGVYTGTEKYDQVPQTLFAPGFRTALAQPASYLAGNLGQAPTLGATPPPNAMQDRVSYGQLIGETVSNAIFGQIDWDFADRWTFTLGLRYAKDEKDLEEQARFLQITPTVAGDTVVDQTFLAFRGYSSINSPTATLPPGVIAGAVPPGYYTVDLAQFPTTVVGGQTMAILPDESLIPTTVTVGGQPVPQVLLFAPGTVGFPYMLANGARARKLHVESDAVTGTLGVDFKPNEDTMAYARYARGYRPAGLNAGFLNALPLVHPEFVNSYEIGAKTTINGRIRLNSALFYYDYTDIQLPLPIYDRCTTPGDFLTCTRISTFINMPSAVSKGFELEGQWFPTDDFQITFTYGYVDAYVKDGRDPYGLGFDNADDPAALLPTAQRFLPITCAPAGTAACQVRSIPGFTLQPGQGYAIDSPTGEVRWTQDLSGNPLVASPKHKVATNFSYTFRDFMSRGDLTLSTSFIWRDKSYGDIFGTELSVTPSYTQTNFRAVFDDNEDKYRIILWVSNLFDQDVYEFASVTRQAAGVPGAGQVYYRGFELVPPRTFGLEVQRRF